MLPPSEEGVGGGNVLQQSAPGTAVRRSKARSCCVQGCAHYGALWGNKMKE